MNSNRLSYKQQPLFLVWVTSFAFSLILLFTSPLLAKSKDNCIQCHKDPNLLVTNKKLFKHYQAWEKSAHSHAGVSCTNCHGGNPAARDKTKAHSKSLQFHSTINFKKIPKTCSTCHQEIYQGYKQSRHFKFLSQKQKISGPNCITCHNTMNNVALNIMTIKATCKNCHNSKIHPNTAIPDRAETLMNQFLAIHRFYRYVSIKGDPIQMRPFLLKTHKKIKRLSKTWHSFKMDVIERETKIILQSLQKKRKELEKK